jgi:uncharacterized protein with PIN domain
LINNIFLCPECGSGIVKENFHYKSKLGNHLYSDVLHEIQCGSCFMDIPGHLGLRVSNMKNEEAKNQWIKKYRPEHIKDAAKCHNCKLYYWEIEKKLENNLDKNKNIFMQKFTKNKNPDLICRICEPGEFK